MRIAIFSPGFGSWAAADRDLLATFGEVTSVDVLKTGLWHRLREVWRADLCFFWFGTYRHLPLVILAWLLDKRILMVAGGYDVNRREDIGYGQIRHGWLRAMMFEMADRVLANSEFTRKSALETLDLSPFDIETVYLAVRVADIKLNPWHSRKSQAVFLISTSDDAHLVKGIDRIQEICRTLPQVQFKLAGNLAPGVKSMLARETPQNLEYLGYVDFHSAQFLQLLNESKAVVVPSRLESFNAASLDGAAMGCVPVVFDVGALPEVLVAQGRLAKADDVPDLCRHIAGVMALDDVNVEALRREVQNRFSLELRREKLAQVIVGLCDAQIMPLSPS